MIPPVKITQIVDSRGRPRWVLDWRKRNGVPHLHRGMYFDDGAQINAYEVLSGRAPSPEALAARAELERRRRVELHQPWEER